MNVRNHRGEAMPEVQLVHITRIYQKGCTRVNLLREIAELEAKLHAQLSEHCRVTGSRVTCDYAGFRTLDSVVRAKTVFGLQEFTIVTEEFHCPRTLWIARQHGLEAVAFAAPDLSIRWSARVKARESLARVWCAMDLYVLGRRPHFPGPPEPIVLSGG